MQLRKFGFILLATIASLQLNAQQIKVIPEPTEVKMGNGLDKFPFQCLLVLKLLERK
jgi:hypothetical protein